MDLTAAAAAALEDDDAAAVVAALNAAAAAVASVSASSGGSSISPRGNASSFLELSPQSPPSTPKSPRLFRKLTRAPDKHKGSMSDSGGGASLGVGSPRSDSNRSQTDSRKGSSSQTDSQRRAQRSAGTVVVRLPEGRSTLLSSQ